MRRPRPWRILRAVKRLLIVLAGILVGALLYLMAPDEPANNPEPPATASGSALGEVTGLQVPWEAIELPDRRILVTERPGRVRVIENGLLRDQPMATITEVAAQGEGGLMGLAAAPDYAQSKHIFLYYTYATGGELRNRVARYRDSGDALIEPTTIVDDIPGNRNHDGGRIAFGPDGKLYVATGDSQEPSTAQDRNSLAGKILRVNPDGSVPADNPFGSRLWSLGHRNVQGLAWDEQGRLYASEHGPSGDLGLCCRDELNLIEKGGNYGWPQVTGDESRAGFIAPLAFSGNSGTWAPAGLAYKNGKLYLATLRGAHLRVFTLQDGKVTAQEERVTDRGRLRLVLLLRDGRLLLGTSNRDGRGEVRPGDDRLIPVSP